MALPDDQGRARIAVSVVAAGSSERARALARALGLPYDDTDRLAAPLRLVLADDGLALHDADSGARLRVSYAAAALRRLRAGGPGGDPLRRAIGPLPRRVADATAGLGRDAVHLAALGYEVAAIERDRIASALVEDGLRRARAARLLPEDNPRWRCGDARALLPALDPAPDTVYLDPMFPPKRKKSAAARKEMRLLRLLGAHEEDAAALFAVACACARERVVVKRPLAAEPLAPHPTAVYRGKLVRYDVYRTTRA
jgi:16S rRNA (guanine1516-N2)-methyltransferase